MRVKLKLRSIQNRCILPINYQYHLSSAIYNILSQSSSEFSEWLHEKGYLTKQGKPLKFFVFSKLYIPKVKRENASLIVRKTSQCSLFVDSPIIDDFVQNFVVGLFSSNQIEIKSIYGRANFFIEQVEAVSEPTFKNKMKFKCLSPIVVSKGKEKNGQFYEHYFRPLEPDLSESIRKNLISKYHTLRHTLPENQELEFQIDMEYLKKRGGEEKISKLIHIKEGTSEETRVKAFETPFYLSGSPELMKIAYECGIGHKNSMGFGMVEVVE